MASPFRRILRALVAGISIGCGCSADRSVLHSTPYECASGSLISCRGSTSPSGGERDAGSLLPDSGLGEVGAVGQGRAPTLDAAPSSVVAGLVGARCVVDLDCLPGLACELASSPGAAFALGGPPGGYCTASCALDVDCALLDPLAACYAPGGVGPGPGYCLKTCSLDLGAGVKQCEGRHELACVAPASGGPSFCYPVCGSDADCAPGSCNLFSGLCVSTPFSGDKPIGGPCTDDFECRSGWCLSIDNQRRACSGMCIYDSVGGCGYPTTTELRVAGCLTQRSPDLPSGLPQLGWCSELCDRDADCILSSSGWFCQEWPEAEAERASGKWGRLGQCVQPTEGLCTDDCAFAFDGYCDDGGPDSSDTSPSLCELGADCTDCGPR